MQRKKAQGIVKIRFADTSNSIMDGRLHAWKDFLSSISAENAFKSRFAYESRITFRDK